MKKLWAIVGLALLLTGCGVSETFETLADDYAAVQSSAPQKLVFAVPDDAAEQVMQSESGTLYFCDGYEITVQTLHAGDLDRTLRAITGYGEESLTVMRTENGNMKRYACTWTAAGEAGDMVGRTLIVDDGNYHYCLSVTANAQEAGSLQESWNALFRSVEIQS